MSSNRHEVLDAMLQNALPGVRQNPNHAGSLGKPRPFGAYFGLGSDATSLQSQVNRLRSYVDTLPKMRSYTPSPSENRSFWLRQNLGPAMGRQVNEGLDFIDHVTPLRDFVHRRRQGYPWNWDDTATVGGTILGLGAPFAARPIGKAAQKGGWLVDDLVKKRMPGLHERWHTSKIQRQLDHPTPVTTKIGAADRNLLSRINSLRALEKEQPIGGRDIRIYQKVLEKLQDKRMGQENMASNDLADRIYGLVHKKGATVELGKYPTAQMLVNENTRPPNVGFVGRGPQDDVSLKSVFPVRPKQLENMRKK